jgi:D-sedoheptulose 7-phosphate isomerase
MKNKIKKIISESIDVKTQLMNDSILLDMILEISDNCVNSLQNGGKIIFCGNGGSFADAQHLSAEFTSRFLFDREGLASIALGTNSSAMSAIGNDYGYENIFSRELESIGNANDIFISFTTSGNSTNVLKALDVAKNKKIKFYVFTGKTAGKVAGLKNCINVPSDDTARIQESHIMLGHIICGFVESAIFAK